MDREPLTRALPRGAPALLSIVIAAGCGDSAGPAGPRDAASGVDVAADSTPPCTEWPLSDFASNVMAPGADCLECHDRWRGPLGPLTIAGTVFASADHEDGCQGVNGQRILVIDANGLELEMGTNLAGNFYTQDERVAFPIRAGFVGAPETMMTTPVFDGSCNSCHTPEGSNGASGRIVPP